MKSAHKRDSKKFPDQLKRKEEFRSNGTEKNVYFLVNYNLFGWGLQVVGYWSLGDGCSQAPQQCCQRLQGATAKLDMHRLSSFMWSE